MPKTYSLNPIGFIQSPLTNIEDAPKQGSEGAPDAWIDVAANVAEGIDGITAGDEIVLITWFDRASRNVLKVHPRSDRSRPLTGVFLTRSPDRPNPLGLHRVRVLEVAGTRIKVGPLEAVDGTPVVDIKPVLQESTDC